MRPLLARVPNAERSSLGIPFSASHIASPCELFCPLRQRSGFSTVEFVELQTNRTRRHPILHLLANFFSLCASGVALAQSSSSSCRPTGHVGQLSRKRKELVWSWVLLPLAGFCFFIRMLTDSVSFRNFTR